MVCTYIDSRNKSKLHQLLCSSYSIYLQYLQLHIRCGSNLWFSLGNTVLAFTPLSPWNSWWWYYHLPNSDCPCFANDLTQGKWRIFPNIVDIFVLQCATAKNMPLYPVLPTLWQNTCYVHIHVMPNIHKNACWIRKLCSQIWILNCSFSCTSKILQIFQQRYSW